MTKKIIPSNPKSIKICSVKDCESNEKIAKGYCLKHYLRLRSYGRLHSIRLRGKGATDESRFWSKVAITANPDKCWLWLSVKPTSYGQHKYKNKMWFAHRLAWYFANKKTPSLWILHSCDTPACVNPRHLREGTPKDNSKDKYERNRANPPKGERQWKSKLSGEKVRKIRSMLADGLTQSAIAKKFNVDQSTISYIKRHKIWSHI